MNTISILLKKFLFRLIVPITGLLIGIVLLKLDIPIPFLLGSVFMVLIAYKIGIQVKKPNSTFSRWMRVVIGVSLGNSVAENIGLFSLSTLGSALLAIGFTITVTAIGMFLFKSTLAFNNREAFISSLPGGLSFLISLAGDLGNQFPKIALIHATRIVTLVFALSALAYLLGVSDQQKEGVNFYDINISNGLWSIVILILISGVIAETVKMPGGHVIFGLTISSLAYSFAYVQEPMPELMITIAMSLLGLFLGTAFVGTNNRQYPRMVALSMFFTFIALAIASLLAFQISQGFNNQFLLIFLALAPGGIAEISIIALALGLDAGFVVVVHACRFFFIMLMGALGLHYFKIKG